MKPFVLVIAFAAFPFLPRVSAGAEQSALPATAEGDFTVKNFTFRSGESLENLRLNLTEQGYDLDKLPYVIQYNKRDLPNAAPMEQLRPVLNPTKVPEFEACATSGAGVFDTLKAVAKAVLTELKRGS